MKKVTVVEYDTNWPQLFEQLAAPIRSALGDVVLGVEHVGSTAVPGLAAKPVIDIDVIVPDGALANGIIRLEELGYIHVGDQGVPQREAFKRPGDVVPHHLYLCPSSSPALANHIAVRDYLRTHPDTAREYGNLKKRLALAHPHDIDGYIEGKTRLLVEVLWAQGFSSQALDDVEAMNRRPA